MQVTLNRIPAHFFRKFIDKMIVLLFQSFRSSSVNLAISGLDTVRQVEAKQPALLFKLQLSAYVEKMYGIVRDNWKRDLASLLTSCIQVNHHVLQKFYDNILYTYVCVLGKYMYVLLGKYMYVF